MTSLESEEQDKVVKGLQSDARSTSLNASLNRLLASAVGSIIAESITLPTDVVKTRLQVQNFAAQSSSRMYTGMLDAMINIPKEEGMSGLFKGIQPALIRQIRDGISSLTNHGDSNKKPGFVTRVLSGGIAGAIGISVMNPTEMQTNQSLHGAPSMTSIMKNVFKNDGIFGFWAGVYPNICRAFLVNAAELGIYDNAKNWIINDWKLCEDGMMGHVAASFAAGTSSAMVSTPVDVVKTRLMNQAGSTSKQYQKGMIGTLISIPREEGFRALYKGFFPIICRKVIWCTAFFVTYEQMRVALGMKSS